MQVGLCISLILGKGIWVWEPGSVVKHLPSWFTKTKQQNPKYQDKDIYMYFERLFIT